MDPPILTTWYWGPPLLPRHIQAHTSMCRSGHQTHSLEKQNSCVFFGASRCRFSMSKFCCGCWFEWPNGLVASNILQCGTAACIYNVRLSSIFSWIVYIKFKLYIVYIHIYSIGLLMLRVYMIIASASVSMANGSKPIRAARCSRNGFNHRCCPLQMGPTSLLPSSCSKAPFLSFRNKR